MKTFCALLLIFFSPDEHRAVVQKFDRIEQERTRPGESIVFTPHELAVYSQVEADKIAPNSVHDVRLAFGSQACTASARIDFLNLNKVRGGPPPSWLMEKLLEGDRQLKVTARVQSENGRARVDVERAEVSGIAVEGRMLDFLIQSYLRPNLPDAKVAQWFDLAHRMDHFEISPAKAEVVIQK